VWLSLIHKAGLVLILHRPVLLKVNKRVAQLLVPQMADGNVSSAWIDIPLQVGQEEDWERTVAAFCLQLERSNQDKQTAPSS
jgi:hypothetical protein